MTTKTATKPATATTETLAGAAVSPARLTKTAREYLRVSSDTSGEGKSTDEQHTDNLTAAGREGFTLGAPYRDDGRSASRHTTKVREDFERLMGDLRSGAFGADVLILWESSRGSRKVGEWVSMLDLLAERGILVHVTTHGRTYDPRNARDRRSLLEDAVDSEYESDKIAQRVRRTKAARAAAGAPDGRAPLGYLRLYDPVTRKRTAQVPDDSDQIPADLRPDVPMAPRIRELFDRIRRGDALKAIERDWKAAGVVSPTRTTRKGAVVGGKPYTAAHLRSLALTYAYAGLRVHVPYGASGSSSRKPTPGQIFEGSWDAIVDRETFYAVQNILADPSRRTSRPGRANHLLTMTARCDVCGSVVTFRATKTRQGKPRPDALWCRARNCVRVPEAEVDAYAEERMLNVLGSVDVGGLLDKRNADHGELRAVRAEIAELGQRLDSLADNISIPEAVLARRATALKAALTAARERERDLSTPDVLRGLIEPGQGVEDRWKLLPMETKRQVARILFSPSALGYLTITRAPVRNAGVKADPVERLKLRKIAPEVWTNGPGAAA